MFVRVRPHRTGGRSHHDGNAELHDDAATVQAKNFYAKEQIAQYGPGFPSGYVMFVVRPLWLEISAPQSAIEVTARVGGRQV